MKVSTRGRYGLRIMLELAAGWGGAALSAAELARRQELSEKYAESIVNALVRAGFLRAVRGRGGGYALSREPEQYTVGEILRALEGSLAPVDCAEDCTTCPRSNRCVTIRVWRAVKEAVDGVVDNIRLSDLAAQYRGQREGISEDLN